ncbi:MAG: carbon-nitrogen hydrolase family protein [Clostridia bacterium]|nr:MAG: carbon-nitrogen hydrolase family protein [Clostridia bacterium]
MRVAAVQMSSGADKGQNLARAEELVREAVRQGAGLVSLPEHFSCLVPEAERPGQAEPVPGPTTAFLAALSRELGIYLHAGSLLEQAGEPGKCYNTGILFGPGGDILAAYRKIHLFDVSVGGHGYHESATTLAGEEVVAVPTPLTILGLSICYDLRFPELYRRLAGAGAGVLFVPAAFTMYTGKDHWEILVRARAIENQAYVVAAAQFGGSYFGHSMIVDPWGTPLAVAQEREMVVVAAIDLAWLEKVRSDLPSLHNRRLD